MKHYPRIILFPVTTILCTRLVESTQMRIKATRDLKRDQAERELQHSYESLFFLCVVVLMILTFLCTHFTYFRLRLVCLDPGEQAFYALKCPTLCRYRISTTLCPPLFLGGGVGAAQYFPNSHLSYVCQYLCTAVGIDCFLTTQRTPPPTVHVATTSRGKQVNLMCEL